MRGTILAGTIFELKNLILELMLQYGSDTPFQIAISLKMADGVVKTPAALGQITKLLQPISSKMIGQ